MKKSDINSPPGYFDHYINLVDDVEILQAFDDSIRQLDELDKTTLEKLDGKIYAPGKWTVKGHFQHVADFERILSYRTLLFAGREGSIPQGVEQDVLAANMNADERTVDSVIGELKAVRLSTKAMFAGFDDAILQSTGTNWKSEMSVLAMGFAMLGHQIHHLKLIEEKYFPLLETEKDD